MSPETFRNILFSESGLALGTALYALGVYTFVMRRRGVVNTVGFLMVKASWLMTVGMVFLTIIVPITAIEPTWQGWVYALGLASGTLGFLMVSRTVWKEEAAYQAGALMHRRSTDEKSDNE